MTFLWASMPPSHLRALAIGPEHTLGQEMREGWRRLVAKRAVLDWVGRNYCGACGGHQDEHHLDCPALIEAMKQMRAA